MNRRKGFWIATTLVAGGGLAACSPVAQHLSSSASPSVSLPVSPTPTATPPDPIAAAFWDDTNGLLILTPGCTSGDNICPGGVIERTGDAGRTWRIIDHVSASLSAIAVAGNDVAWVSESGAGCGAGGACMASNLLITSDGGADWADVVSPTPVASVSPQSATAAWAVGGSSGFTGAGTRLVRTTDGGHTWEQRTDPCSGVHGVGPLTVSFAGAVHGWLTCAGLPATDLQPKALFSTRDGGATWQLQSDACLESATGQPTRDVGMLSCVGDVELMSSLPDDHAWMWMARGSLSATANGGVSWAPIAMNIVSDDINDALSASLVSDMDGFLLITRQEIQTGCTPSSCGPQLLSTTDGGRSWTIMSSWVP